MQIYFFGGAGVEVMVLPIDIIPSRYLTLLLPTMTLNKNFISLSFGFLCQLFGSLEDVTVYRTGLASVTCCSMHISYLMSVSNSS